MMRPLRAASSSMAKRSLTPWAISARTSSGVRRLAAANASRLLACATRSYVVSLRVEQANSLEALAAASRRTPELVRALMAQGVKLRFAMELLAALNGRIMHKAWGFLIDERYHADSCLIVMGSEGRGEQILKTDQDNGLILTDDLEWPDC